MTDTIEAYLARGGKITVLQPGVANFGYSPQNGKIGGTEMHVSMTTEEVAAKRGSNRHLFETTVKVPTREVDVVAQNAKRTAMNNARRKVFIERLSRIKSWIDEGVSSNEIAARERIGNSRARELIAKAKLLEAS